MKKLCGFIAMALCVVACNKINEKNVQPEGMPFSATIRIDDGAVTKALSEDGTTLVASWAAGEKVGLVHGVVDEMTVTPNGDGTATISGTITNSPADGAPVTIVYPASAAQAYGSGIKPDLLKVQNGLLTGEGSISKKYDVRKGSGTFKVDGETVTLSETVSLTNQNAIIKFSIGSKTIDSNLPFYILNGNNEIITTVIPSSPGAVSTFYVAMAPVTEGSFKFVWGESDGYKYYQTKTATIAAGKYYQSPLTGWTVRSPQLISFVEAGDIGSVIGSDRKIYFNSYAATHRGTTPLAMIAYVGNASDCTKGLAIALEDVSSSEYTWADAPGAVTNWATGKAIDGGAWRIPTLVDWQNMFIGSGAGGPVNPSPSYDSDMSYSGLASMLEMAQGTALQWDHYWSGSSYSEDNAWRLKFDGSKASFYYDGKTNTDYVRACIAF